MYAVNGNGALVWKKAFLVSREGYSPRGRIFATVIMADGQLYFSSNAYYNEDPGWKAFLYSVKASDGTLNWSYNVAPDGRALFFESVAIDKSNNVYAVYQGRENVFINCFIVSLDRAGHLRYNKPLRKLIETDHIFVVSRPLLSEDNASVYVLTEEDVGDFTVYLNTINASTGNLERAILPFPVYSYYCSMGRSRTNVLYFMGTDIDYNLVVFGVKDNVTVMTTVIPAPPGGRVYAQIISPTVASDGTIYVPLFFVDSTIYSKIYAIKADGSVKWSTLVNMPTDTNIVQNSLAVDKNGRLIGICNHTDSADSSVQFCSLFTLT
jgi:outer membrane protein assembly factor BamB